MSELLTTSRCYDYLSAGYSLEFGTYDNQRSFMARHSIKLKNRWGQPRVSSTLTFGTSYCPVVSMP